MSNGSSIPTGKKISGKSAGKIVIGVVGIIVAVVLVMNSFTIVSAGYKGVLLNFGAVSPRILDEGFNFKIPFYQTVVPMEVRIQKAESDQTAASKDLQTITTKLAVNFSISDESVAKLYNNVGLDYENRVVSPAISESLKAVTAKYTANDLVQKREAVSGEIKDTLTARLQSYGVIVENISIRDFHFSKEYNDAIEAKQVAEQQVQKAKSVLERVKIEKEQAIEQARAQAESLRLQKQEVTPELIELRKIETQQKAIEKWDGKLPSVTGGSIPMIDATGLQAK